MSLKEYSELKELPETKKRGYLFIYNAKDLELVKERMRFLLDKWYESMKRTIREMGSLIDCYKTDGNLC
jgi:predicted transcriptional regulator